MSGETVIYNIDISELVDIGTQQLEQLILQNDILNHQNQLAEISNSLNACLLVILGAVLGAVVFRHLRK